MEKKEFKNRLFWMFFGIVLMLGTVQLGVLYSDYLFIFNKELWDVSIWLVPLGALAGLWIRK